MKNCAVDNILKGTLLDFVRYVTQPPGCSGPSPARGAAQSTRSGVASLHRRVGDSTLSVEFTRHMRPAWGPARPGEMWRFVENNAPHLTRRRGIAAMS